MKPKSVDYCDSCFECLNDGSNTLVNPAYKRMIVCVKCGNKRCPKATNHRFECTNSNEPNQWGSRY